MADLIAFVTSDPGLTTTRRRNLASSIRRFCAALGYRPEEAAAAFDFFRGRLRGFAPAQAGIKPHRWQTIRSDVAFALKRSAASPGRRHGRMQIDGTWAAARSRITAQAPWAVSRLARFCSERGITPSAVDDAIIDAYMEDYREQTFKTGPERHHRELCRLWNRLAAEAPDLALQPVTLPRYLEPYTPAWASLPDTFREQADAWLQSMSEEGDLLAEEGPLRPLRPASIKAYRYALRQAAAGLIAAGRPLDSIASLKALVEDDAPKLALQFYLDRNGGQPTKMVSMIAHVLVLVAQHAVKVEPRMLDQLKRYRTNLTPKRNGLRPRPQKALRQFADRANIEKLLLLPLRIYLRLARKQNHSLADARLMQVAVALELLLMRPIRRSNLIGLRLGEHVLKIGKRTVIVLDPAEVKNGVGHDYGIPPESARMLDFYVDRLLPLFGDNPMRFLFPGAVTGRVKSGEQFGRFFTKTVRQEIGLEVYPHLLRHFGATLYLTERPEGLEVVRRVLGHRSADTAQRSYAGVHDELAVRRFDELVLGIRATILKEIGSD